LSAPNHHGPALLKRLRIDDTELPVALTVGWDLPEQARPSISAKFAVALWDRLNRAAPAQVSEVSAANEPLGCPLTA
jgi:hypothetical protein